MRYIRPIVITAFSAIAFNAYANIVSIPFSNVEVTPEKSLTVHYSLKHNDIIFCKSKIGSGNTYIEWEYQNQKFIRLLPLMLTTEGPNKLENVLQIISESKTEVSCQILCYK